MPKKATEFQKKEMSKMYRGKEIFKTLKIPAGSMKTRPACANGWRTSFSTARVIRSL